MQELNIGDLVIYKNNQLLALNKPAGIPTQPDKTTDISLLQLAEIYGKSKIHLIHRIDRAASGLVLMAKNPKALAILNQQFQDRSTTKKYLAVVKGNLPETEGSLTHYLRKDSRRHKSYASETEQPGSKRAELQYRTLDEIDNYSLLEITLITGRFHQIRAQLAAINFPIKGDVKYGARRKNADRSIHLHAWKLAFNHPVTNERVALTAPVPAEDSVWQAFNLPI